MRPIVGLLTDFGTRDGFVGVMKGVMLSINPELQLVDISHQVEPFNVLEGALLLKAHYGYFPENTIFVCVIDPGVGSQRQPIAIKCGKYFFVGPHNGIFDLALKDIKEDILAYKIERYTLPRVNETFHGRDVFAPVAGHISKGISLENVGKRIEYEFLLPWEGPKLLENKIVGKVIYFDKFGNCITNIPCGNYAYGEFRGKKSDVVSYFIQKKGRKPAFVCGSFGYMELFIPMGSAQVLLKVKKGEEVSFYTP
jgi:S-adenosylmethionine hydrolase